MNPSHILPLLRHLLAAYRKGFFFFCPTNPSTLWKEARKAKRSKLPAQKITEALADILALALAIDRVLQQRTAKEAASQVPKELVSLADNVLGSTPFLSTNDSATLAKIFHMISPGQHLQAFAEHRFNHHFQAIEAQIAAQEEKQTA